MRRRWPRWRACARASPLRPRLAASLAALRERDDKAHLAYALNEAAALALGTGDATVATRLAAEALAAALAVRRATQIARARATIAAAAPARRLNH